MLFAQRSYAAVTIDDIVKAAGISRRSFFRYFSDKFDILLADGRRRYQAVCQEFARRPPDEPSFDSLCQSFLAAAVFDRQELKVLKRFGTVFASDPSRFERTLASAEGMGEQLSEIMAKRLDIDPAADMRADLLVRLVRAGAHAAQRHWIMGEYEHSLTDLMQNAFDLIGGPLLAEIATLESEARQRRERS